MARPPRIWTDEQRDLFEKLCGIFCTRKECANMLGMDVRTLDKNIQRSYPDTPTWEEAFELFSAKGKASLRRRQFELAMDGNVAMLIFLGKNFLKQSDNPAKTQEDEPSARQGKLQDFSSYAKVI